MQTNIFWEGLEYHSLENCLIITTDAGNKIHSTIVGMHDNSIYTVEYLIETNTNWETISIAINSQINGVINRMHYEGDGNGNWTIDGKVADQIKGCIDVDISLTPFTNSLPINRLQLAEKETQLISVLYFNILEQVVQKVGQRYTKLAGAKYNYQNFPNDFEADIMVDESGLVIGYPNLFVRKAKT